MSEELIKSLYALIDNLTDKVIKLDEKIESMNIQMAQLHVLHNAQIARLDILDKEVKGGINISNKRSIKLITKNDTVNSEGSEEVDDDVVSKSTTAIKKEKKEKKEKKSVTTTTKSKEKVTKKEIVVRTTELFFKYIVIYQNYNNMRDEYNDMIDQFSTDIDDNKGDISWYLNIASKIWSTFSKEDIKELLTKFQKWKSNTTDHKISLV